MADAARLARLLAPRSVAVIGGSEAATVVRQLRRIGFAGAIHAVNPRRAEIEGIATVASVAELAEVPDAAFVAVARHAAVEAVAALAERGAAGAVCYASGFNESGTDGRDLEARLKAAAGEMPVLGPNCYGFINYLEAAALWPDEFGGAATARGVAIVTQSGNMAVNFTLHKRGLPLAGIYTLGNQMNVTIADVVAALARDERITAIGLHIEALGDLAAFADAVDAARAAGVPVVALKTGRSVAGARLTESHTSSMAGADRLYDALFARLGIARVQTVTQLLETLKLLHHGGPLAGNRIASMSCSGGEAALVADLGADRGLEFPDFAPAQAAKVRATLGELVAVSNPLDYHTFIWGDEAALEACFAAVMGGGFDAAMLVLDVPDIAGLDATQWLASARALAHAAQATGARALVVASLPECLPQAVRDELAALGVAPMMGIDDALTALAAAAAIGAAWRDGESAWRPALPGAPASDAQPLDETQAKVLLAAQGVPVPEGVAVEAAHARSAADMLGYPVALKALDAKLTHKSEAGGVALDLRDGNAVEAAANAMAHLSGRVLVERMVGDAVAEVIVGIEADPQFGLALLVGSGGVLAELVGDSALVLLPARETEVRAALSRLRVAALLDGVRGRPAGDRDALVAAVMAIARFALDNADRLAGLDANPLMVRPQGHGVCAADAWMRISR